MFGAILVTGPRQTGKTTMLMHIVKKSEYVTLDDPQMPTAVLEHSGKLFKDNNSG